MDAWERMVEEERQNLLFLLGEEFSKECFVVQNSIIQHDDLNPFCDCVACHAELEAMLQSSLLRQAENRTIAQRTAREMRLERIEARLEEMERRVAALEERLGE